MVSIRRKEQERGYSTTVYTKTKNPDAGSGLDEVKYGYLLSNHRYAHIDLPTMRGLNMMMVMVVCKTVVHSERQYTNRLGIWQVISACVLQTRSDAIDG